MGGAYAERRDGLLVVGPAAEWPIVELLWIDSIAGATGWSSVGSLLEEAADNYLVHRSVGYLVAETEQSVLLVSSFQEDAELDAERNVQGGTRIPKVAILLRRELERR
jgi:hypothetical protein